MVHSCEAVVVSCIDFRLQKHIRNWTDRKLKGRTFDYVGIAGSTKNLRILLDQIEISVKLHRVKEVHLINHEDCGAYGVGGTLGRHKIDLKKAKSKILSKYPQLSIYLYYLHLDGYFDNIL